MDLLIKHGTWIAIPAGLALSFIYLHVYAKVYPFLVARSLAREDERRRVVLIRRIFQSRNLRPVRQAAGPAKAS